MFKLKHFLLLICEVEVLLIIGTRFFNIGFMWFEVALVQNRRSKPRTLDDGRQCGANLQIPQIHGALVVLGGNLYKSIRLGFEFRVWRIARLHSLSFLLPYFCSYSRLVFVFLMSGFLLALFSLSGLDVSSQ